MTIAMNFLSLRATVRNPLINAHIDLLPSATLFCKRFYRSPEYPTKVWKPQLDDRDREIISDIHKTRKRRLLKILNNPASPILRKQSPGFAMDGVQINEYPWKQTSNDYVVLDVQNRLFKVQLNDVIIMKKLPGTRVGDSLKLTKVKELGNKTHILKGNPFISGDYHDIKLSVLSHMRSAKYTKYRRRRGRGPGDKKWRKISSRDWLSIVRVTKISWPKISDLKPLLDK